jgi:hypothetical protein
MGLVIALKLELEREREERQGRTSCSELVSYEWRELATVERRSKEARVNRLRTASYLCTHMPQSGHVKRCLGFWRETIACGR